MIRQSLVPRFCCELSQEEPAFLMVLERVIFLEDCFKQEVKEGKLDTLFHFLLRLQMPGEEGEGMNLIDLCPLRSSAPTPRHRVHLSLCCLLRVFPFSPLIHLPPPFFFALPLLQIWVRKTSDSTKMRIYLGQLQRGVFVIRRRSAT